MKRLNNKGFSVKELILIAAVVSAVVYGVMLLTTDIRDREKFNTFRTSAHNLGRIYLFSDNIIYDERFYLGELIEMEVIEPILNPFYLPEENDQYCDNFESYVEVKDMLYVTLQCGNYIIRNEIENQNISEYDIYSVSDWSIEFPALTDGDELVEKVMYNYIENNNEVLYRYYPDHTFVRLYNIAKGSFYKTSDDIKSLSTVVENTFYRTYKKLDI